MIYDNLHTSNQHAPQILDKPLFVGTKVIDFLWFPLLVLGSTLLGIANETFSALPVAIFLACLGIMIISIIFRKNRRELELGAFLLTFGTSVFVSGLAQYYALSTFGVVQTTTDAIYAFFPNISPVPPFTKAEDIPFPFNSPLAILIWQQVYALTWMIGLKFGPYIGVIFNSFTIGLVGAMIIRIARELLGDDSWRLRRLSIFTASCGLFWLFGAIFIRDCFILFFNTLVLWSLVIWLNRPSLKNFSVALCVVGIASVPMVFLRIEGTILFGIFFMLAVWVWYLQEKLNLQRILVAMVTLTMIAGSFGFLNQYFETAMFFGERGFDGYLEKATEKAQTDSLGMSLMMNQPMPIRLVIGSGAILLFPIPLWASIQPGVSEYHLIKTFNGIFQVIIAPFVFTGFVMVYRSLFHKKDTIFGPVLFLALYSLIGLLSVVATSMETRHFGQFLPAFLILSILPDTRVPRIKRFVRRVSFVWFAIVFSIHVLWLFLKF